MGKKTAISWTNSSHNFWIGCHKVSPGCKLCYAERQMKQYGRDFKTVTRTVGFAKPLKWKEPRMIFVNSWSDFFIEEADRWREDAWDIIRKTPHHTYQVLTKRPERIPDSLPADWGEGWPHVWLGVSIETQAYMHRAKELIEVPAAVRFVSAEPLLGPLVFDSLVNDLDWLIIGGESGLHHRPMKMEWARALRDEWKAVDKPVFFKQQGGQRPGYNAYLIEEDGTHTVLQEWPE
jgi:protein gp37